MFLLRKSHVKTYERRTKSGKEVMVKEHDDKRSKKQQQASEEKGAPATGGALARLKAFAEQVSPEEFDKNMKPGMGAMTPAQVMDRIEDHADGEASISELKKKLEAGGQHYLSMGLSNKSLQELKGIDKGAKVPHDYQNDAPAVIVNGEVVEGKYRVAAALQSGSRLSVIMPAKEWHQRVVKGQAGESQGEAEKGQQAAAQEPEGAKQDNGDGKKSDIETQLGDCPASLREKCQRAAAGEGKEISMTKGEVYLLLERGVVGIISAGKNPKLEKDMKPAEEKKRHEELRADLKQRGLMHMQVLGMYEGKEDSFMVFTPDVRKDELTEMGKKYNQDSVVFVDHGKNQMIFTTGENEGQHHPGKGYEKIDNQAEDYYTEFDDADGGKSRFSLNFDWDSLQKALYRFFSDRLSKSEVKAHTRKTKSGKVVMINEYADKRTKKVAPKKAVSKKEAAPNVKQFTAGQKLQARSIGDSNTIFEGEVVKRTAKTVTVKTRMKGVQSYRVKVDGDGNEFIFPFGQYSMAPIFKA